MIIRKIKKELSAIIEELRQITVNCGKFLHICIKYCLMWWFQEGFKKALIGHAD